MSSNAIEYCPFIKQEIKWNSCYFNKLEVCKCDLVYPSFDFLLNAGNFCWISPSIFFFTPGLTFDLLGDSCQYFSLLPVSQKNVLTLEAGLHPTQGAECINFLTRSLRQAVHRSPSQTAKLTESPVSLQLVPMSVKEMSTYFRSLWQSDTFYHVRQVSGKKNT